MNQNVNKLVEISFNTFAPLSNMHFENAFPNPLAAPVIKATFPTIMIMYLFYIYT